MENNNLNFLKNNNEFKNINSTLINVYTILNAKQFNQAFNYINEKHKEQTIQTKQKFNRIVIFFLVYYFNLDINNFLKFKEYRICSLKVINNILYYRN